MCVLINKNVVDFNESTTLFVVELYPYQSNIAPRLYL